MKPLIVETDSPRGYRFGAFFLIFRNGYWWSNKHGWLRAKKENIRYYSRFKTRQAAEQAIIVAEDTA